MKTIEVNGRTVDEALETALTIATKKGSDLDIDVRVVVDRKTEMS